MNELSDKERILVIEDNEQNIYMISYLLEHAGYEVIQAANGRTGIEIATEERPDLIVLDIQLPEMDGYEIAQRLRKNRSLSSVPIVAVTSYAMVGDRERVLESGCTDYLEKPIDTRTFVNSIRRHLPSKQLSSAN